ncbi:hypothetical protein ACHAPB_002844 [Verticillium nonalfalfae]
MCPITKAFKGGFKDAWPEDILRPVMREATRRANIQPGDVQDVLIGNVLAELGFSKTGRMALNDCGFPVSTTFHTVNRQCSSSLQAITHQAHAILAGQIDVALAGGVESMSKNYASRGRPTDVSPSLQASTVKHATDCLLPMGITSENVARRYVVSRQDQDDYAFLSHQRAEAAQAAGKFDSEIVPVTYSSPVEIDGTKQTTKFTISRDDTIRPGVKREKLGTLKPAFAEDGASTAGNSDVLKRHIRGHLAQKEGQNGKESREPRSSRQADDESGSGVSPRSSGDAENTADTGKLSAARPEQGDDDNLTITVAHVQNPEFDFVTSVAVIDPPTESNDDFDGNELLASDDNDQSLQIKSGLPTADTFAVCIDLYFQRFHPLFPFIHEPTFSARRTPNIILLPICLIGLHLLDPDKTRSFVITQVLRGIERCTAALARPWKRNDSMSLVTVLGSAILYLNFASILEEVAHSELTHALYAKALTVAQQSGLFEGHKATLPTTLSASVMGMHTLLSATWLYIADVRYRTLPSSTDPLRNSLYPGDIFQESSTGAAIAPLLREIYASDHDGLLASDPNAMAFWNNMCVNLTANLDLFEVAAGREGMEAGKTALEKIFVWAQTAHARRACLHAAQVYVCMAKRKISDGTMFMSEIALFNAALVLGLYVYAAPDTLETGTEASLELLDEVDWNQIGDEGLPGWNMEQSDCSYAARRFISEGGAISFNRKSGGGIGDDFVTYYE